MSAPVAIPVAIRVRKWHSENENYQKGVQISYSHISHVPAKGASPALTNILGNHVDLAVLAYPPIQPRVRNGTLRILATTNRKSQEPGVPALAEKGFPEAEALGVWQGFLAPPNLRVVIRDRLA